MGGVERVMYERLGFSETDSERNVNAPIGRIMR